MSRLARFFPIMFLAPVIGMVPPQATASLQLDPRLQFVAMVTRGVIAVASALTLVSGVGAAPTTRAIPRPGIVSLDLRSHRERVFPVVRDLAGLSPEGRRIALVTSPRNDEYQLRVQRLDGSHGRVLLRTRFPDFIGEPRWSPDGRTIAFLLFHPSCSPPCHPVQLWLVRTAGGPPRLLSDDAAGAAWAPGSRRLAFQGELDGAGLARLTVQHEDGTGRASFGGRSYIYSLSWSGDGRRLLYSTNSPGYMDPGPGEIHAVDAVTGRDRVLTTGVDPAWSQDGRFLSFIRRKGNRTTLFLLRKGKLRVVLSRPNFGFSHAWSKTGHRLAFAATNRYGQDRIFVFDPDRAKPLRAVTRWGYGPVPEIVWSRNGRTILFVRTAG